jgi:outer membrane protein assembly factor BamB
MTRSRATRLSRKGGRGASSIDAPLKYCCARRPDGPMRSASGTQRRPYSGEHRVVSVVIVCALISTGLAALPTSEAGSGVHAIRARGRGGAVGSLSPAVPFSASPKLDWPELHRNTHLDGYAGNSGLSVSNASSLGVVWASYLYGAVLDSPVASYDGLLHTMVAYVGTENGNLLAVNVSDGAILWGAWIGSPIRSSPVVWNGSVYVATDTNSEILRLNATTGARDCALPTANAHEGTPIVVRPPGGPPTLYIGSNDDATRNGPLYAMNALNCSLEWTFTGYLNPLGGTTGSWDAAAYVVSGGTPLVLFGTADPDSGVYAINAITGAEVWRFQALNPAPNVYDVGAGGAVGAPGMNGFPDGVIYIPSKYGVLYALNLSDGQPYWSTNFDELSGVHNGTEAGLSTPALEGNTVVLGEANGLVALNAKSGNATWVYRDPHHIEVVASPAIVGPTASSVVVAADISGEVEVVPMLPANSSPTALYSFQTGGYVTASPAVVGGNVLVASTDGYLYDFAVGGGNDPSAATQITYPANSAGVPDPNGSLTISGSAADATGVASVEVAIQENGVGGPWWDTARAGWTEGLNASPAVVANPGATATNWSFTFVPPPSGGAYQVTAYTRSVSGNPAARPAISSFTVSYDPRGPHLWTRSVFAAPGSRVTLYGAHLGANATIQISLSGTVPSNPRGSMPGTRVTVPTGEPFGVSSFVATNLGTLATASAPITIANSWQMQGYDPARTSGEPNDNSLSHLITPGGQKWVDLAWDFVGPGPMTTPPAVANGTVFLGDSRGNVYALANSNAGLLWNWTSPSGSAVTGSPAVDPATGLVFVGFANGSLTALRMSGTNGATTVAWTYALGGLPGAPLFASGRVYDSSSSGEVVALSERTGSALWTRHLASHPSAPLALSPSRGVLAVGQADGNETALNAANGSLRWSFASGGAVTAAATFVGSDLIVGSTGGRVYSLDQSSGAVVWSVAAPGGVSVAGALLETRTGATGAKFAFGTQHGVLVVLQASTGTLDFNVTALGPIVGVACVSGMFVYTTANGAIAATHDYRDLVVWQVRYPGSFASAPVIVDGAIYAGVGNGDLDAWTTFGQAPD